MPEEFDFSELRKYLQGQMDMGEEDLLLDEPWTLTRKKSAAPAPVRPANPMPQMTRPSNPAPFPQHSTPAQPAPAPRPAPAPKLDAGLTIAPRAVKKTTSAYELADSIGAFYDALKTDPLYARAANVVRYEGPEHPRLLILLAAPKPGETGSNFFQSPTGEMLVRLFGSLGYAPDSLGVTYFYKDAPRALSPILLASLRRMLTKELSFVAPEIMITFSEPLFYDVFSKGKNFNDLAGMALDFNGTKTVSLVDAYAMTTDKQLKWLTWKVHIPRSGLFTAAK